MDEMARAIAGLKDGKAPGGDGIPEEVWKHGGDNLFSRLHQLITNAWEVGSVPQTWKDASIITIYKKGDRTDCGTGLWQLLGKYGCPEKFITMIEALHAGMMANVTELTVGGEVSESFNVINGVKQGCVLAPTLFSIFLSAMLDEAFRDMADGVYIQSRQSADLFKVAHFRAKTKTTQILMRELLFADDSALS